jgi:putative PIN family toxin of toxin-antitoxin system
LRAVLDPDVHISALLAPRGVPARVLRAWIDGAFELIASPLLLAELERALAYPKLRKRVPSEDAARFVEWLGRSATTIDDPDVAPPIRSPDVGDDYLLALAAAARAALVTGDGHLLSLDTDLPIYPPATFLTTIAP